MKLLIFGPPGSGKGTFSKMLQKEYGLEHIAFGDYFREQVKEGTELGQKIKEYLEKGELVPDDIVNQVAEKLINGKENFVLDGYPRTVTQAEFLETLTNIDAMILLKVHEEIIIKKTLGRRSCENCGRPYNIADIDEVIDGIHYKLPPLLPKNDMICDDCGGKLVPRADDTEETIRERIKVYEKQTAPVLEYFKGKIPVVETWVNGSPSEVFTVIKQKLEELR